MLLYHLSNWADLASAQVGSTFTLRPGSQCAEGPGVYFSEGTPRLTAAEGAKGRPVAAIRIEACLNDASWWRSKGGKAKKFAKARTWHTNGASLQCKVHSISEIELECGMVGVLHCSWNATSGGGK